MSEAPTLALTTGIVASFVQRNAITLDELPALIKTVHASLAIIERAPQPSSATDVRKATPAQIKRSITADALISFENGKPYRMLKRHLAVLGLTPQAYREKWGLPSNYPMTTPAYSQERRDLAKARGLGTRDRRRNPSAD
jgi:predicted transcriptional regulator